VLLVLLSFSWALLAESGECRAFLDSARKAYEARSYELAAADFARAADACAGSEPLLPLAQAQLMARQLEPSLQTLERLLKLESRNADALKLKGDVLYLLGREPEAEQALQSARTIAPGHPPSTYALARIYYQQKRFPQAISLFRSLIERDPGNYRAHDNLALCYASLQQDADALRHFLKALDLVHKDHPEYDVVYANAAHFFLDRGQYEKAFQLAAEAAKRNPASPRNFFLAGKSLVKLEKHELSVRWFNEAVRLDPDYRDPRYWLAQVYRRSGRHQDAERELEKFRELAKAPRVTR